MQLKDVGLWEKEYASKGIPSSYRTSPTKAVVQFISFLQQVGFQGKTAIDLGAGKGRNAFYLAGHQYHVTCLDLLEANAAEINRNAKSMRAPVEAFCQSVADPWPAAEPYDIALDIFCYKHITCKVSQRRYRNFLKGALKEKGYYLLSLASDDDGFYGPLLAASPQPSQKLIIDPHVNIASFLYSQDEIIEEFSDTLQLVHAEKSQSVSPMHGKQYQRQVLNLIFQKNT